MVLLCYSGKTSILFQYAWKQAEQGRAVLFLCKRNKMEEAAATMTHAKNAEALKGVGMRYAVLCNDLLSGWR